MPPLTVTPTSSSNTCCFSISARVRSSVRNACSLSVSGKSMANSSPPNLQVIAPSPASSLILSATITSAASPATCPYLSLMPFKRSMSIIARERGFPSARAFANSFEYCSLKILRVNSPVNGSVSEYCWAISLRLNEAIYSGMIFSSYNSWLIASPWPWESIDAPRPIPLFRGWRPSHVYGRILEAGRSSTLLLLGRNRGGWRSRPQRTTLRLNRYAEKEWRRSILLFDWPPNNHNAYWVSERHQNQ